MERRHLLVAILVIAYASNIHAGLLSNMKGQSAECANLKTFKDTAEPIIAGLMRALDFINKNLASKSYAEIQGNSSQLRMLFNQNLETMKKMYNKIGSSYSVERNYRQGSGASAQSQGRTPAPTPRRNAGASAGKSAAPHSAEDADLYYDLRKDKPGTALNMDDFF